MIFKGFEMVGHSDIGGGDLIWLFHTIKIFDKLGASATLLITWNNESNLCRIVFLNAFFTIIFTCFFFCFFFSFNTSFLKCLKSYFMEISLQNFV